MNRHVAAYLRVSTDEQDVEHQRADVYALAEREFPGVPVVEYEDSGISASKVALTDRPQSRAMLEAIEAGEVVGVVAWKQDRLSRQGSGEIEAFAHFAAKNDVRIVTRDGELRMDSIASELLSSVLAISAKYESITKGERSRSGQRLLAQQGKWPKGPTPPGYDRADDKRLVPNSHAFLVREAFQRFDRGESRNSIAAWLTDTTGEQWSRHRVRDVLRNRHYVGVIVHDGQEYPGLHEPLVSAELFARVQDRLAEWAGFDMRTSRRTPFGALLRCSDCGGQLRHHSEERRGLFHYSYECLPCHFSLKAEELDLYFALLMNGAADYLSQRLIDPAWYSEIDLGEADELRAELADNTQRRANLLALRENGDTMAELRIDELRRRAEQIERALRRLEQVWESKREVLTAVVDAWPVTDDPWTVSPWQEWSIAERHEAVQACVESISANRNTLTLRPRGFPADLHADFRDGRREGFHAHLRNMGLGVPVGKTALPPWYARPNADSIISTVRVGLSIYVEAVVKSSEILP